MATTEFEHIEQYLQGEMSEAEKTAFEKRLKEDGNLRKQLRAYQDVSDALSRILNPSEEEQSLRGYLKEKQKTYFSTEDTNNRPANRRRWVPFVTLAAAAILALLIWAPWQKNYLDRYGAIEMTSPVVRGENDRDMAAKAAELFNKGDYKSALPLIDSALKIHPKEAQLLFYRGVTYLHTNQNKKARTDLQEIFRGNSVFKYNAAYYIGISYLQDKDKAEAKKWLKKIPEDAAVYPKVKELLKGI